MEEKGRYDERGEGGEGLKHGCMYENATIQHRSKATSTSIGYMEHREG